MLSAISIPTLNGGSSAGISSVNVKRMTIAAEDMPTPPLFIPIAILVAYLEAYETKQMSVGIMAYTILAIMYFILWRTIHNWDV